MPVAKLKQRCARAGGAAVAASGGCDTALVVGSSQRMVSGDKPIIDVPSDHYPDVYGAVSPSDATPNIIRLQCCGFVPSGLGQHWRQESQLFPLSAPKLIPEQPVSLRAAAALISRAPVGNVARTAA